VFDLYLSPSLDCFHHFYLVLSFQFGERITIPEHSFTVPGRLVQAINPTIATQNLNPSYYLLESSFLVALTTNLTGYLSVSDLKGIQKLTPSNIFPYREVSGDDDLLVVQHLRIVLILIDSDI
jgi:hypothetical protein